MRYLFLPLVLALGCSSTQMERTPGAPRPVSVHAKTPDAVSNLHHPLATNAAAQRYFNDGLSQVFAFNHDEAAKQFKKAAEADPKLGMAHWGVALALGPNYNVDVDEAREKQAAVEMAMARELSKDAPQVEKDYIAALSKRFSDAEKPDLKKLAHDYAGAMRQLAEKYPDDLNAATLYADSMMCLKPWQLYTLDGKPVEGTDKIVATLESVLKRDPDHIGANHLYIHATEASTHPERALEAAARLPGLAPTCGHLVHMPSHVYARVGDFESAATSNEAAVAADRDYFTANPDMNNGMYAMMYYPHNMHFLAYSEAEQGNYANAKKWSDQLVAHVKPHVPHMQMLEAFFTVPYGIEVRFQRWDDVLAEPAPDAKATPITAAVAHFARGMAHAARGDSDAAQREQAAMMAVVQTMPADLPFAMVNKAHEVMKVAAKTLDAKMAAQAKQYDDAEKSLREAIKIQDNLNYMEPPDWLLNSREILGGVLLAKGDAAGAEKVFRENLDRIPRAARSLLGLATALEKQGKSYEAGLVKRQFDAAWANADTKLRAEQL